ncbi:diadenylate cyclase [bacterium]|nr:diadenylate cyclase [bacterium]
MLNLFLELFSWRAVLDILLITLGLFFIYATLKRLGTWKMLITVFLIGSVYGIAKLLDLDGLIWFYSNVSQVAMIGFVILFQPEIRKLFESVLVPRRRHMRRQTDTLPALITEAANLLSKQNRGALIVIPGRELIDGYLAGGQMLNAVFSVPLLLSIFDPHSPGHDGAIIIEKGKVQQFGVRLPLSSSDTLPKEYGTRHYAAAGLSEATDALVIAVSEERGVITVFKNGKGDIQTSPEQLIDVINRHWLTNRSLFVPVAKRRGLSPWIEILASFLIASGFWYSVVIGEAEIHEKFITIPIEYTGTPQDLALTGEKTSEVKVHLVGPKSNLVETGDMRVRVDLSKARPGKQQITVTADKINLSKRVKLLDAQPTSLSLELVHMVEQDIAVNAQLVGKLQDSLRIVSVSIIPDKIKSVIRSSDARSGDLVLMTTPIYLENIRTSTTIFGKIVAPPRIQPSDKKWPDVEVQIKVEKRRPAKPIS